MTKTQCPSCGGPITFAIGSSIVVVCEYCRTIVARGDRGPEDHGKVAGLINTGSRLRVHATGKYGGVGFRITGRTQLRHEAGGTWDEWYALFDDGRWVWIAEAQGRFYVTAKTNEAAPPKEQLELGQRVLKLVVTEIGTAALASAEGEIPWKPAAGYSYDYADLTGANREFATIDYSEDAPIVFRGWEVTLRDLGVEGEARETRVKGVRLSCTKCGGPLELRAPDQAERVYCPNCGSAHDVERGNLRYLEALKHGKKVKPVIPLGSKGTIDGDEYVIAGFMQRAVKFDILYYWTEYLLFNEQKGFRWLVHSDDHWSFVTPLRAGEVSDDAPLGVSKTVGYEGKWYALFQDASARVTSVLGEFYWRVEVGETVDTVDYIKPPFGISKEITREGAREINYSHARYMTPREVEKAFGVEDLRRPSAIGPMQPFTGAKLIGPWLVMLALLFGVMLYNAMTKPRRVVVNRMFTLADAPAAPDAEQWGEQNARVLFSEPFELSGEQNIQIEGRAEITNTWVYVAGDLVNESTNELFGFELPIEYYHGYDDGGHWEEGNKKRKSYLARPEKGRYVLRLEAQWEPNKNPPRLHIIVREGVFRMLHFVLALILISVFPALAAIRQFTFESQRWKDSAHSPFGQWSTDDEEDDE